MVSLANKAFEFEQARQNERESESGRVLGRAKRLYMAELSLSVFHTTDRHRNGGGGGRREEEGGMSRQRNKRQISSMEREGVILILFMC